MNNINRIYFIIYNFITPKPAETSGGLCYVTIIARLLALQVFSNRAGKMAIGLVRHEPPRTHNICRDVDILFWYTYILRGSQIHM